MVSDQPHKHPKDEKIVVEGDIEPEKRPLNYLPFAIQPQNILAIEIIAKRFPVITSNPPTTQLNINLDGVHIDNENLQAQVIYSVRVDCVDDPPPFEISFKLLGIFTHDGSYKTEMIHTFLEQGCLSIMLPFARELLLSLCTRLQIHPLLMPLAQIAPFQNENETETAPD